MTMRQPNPRDLTAEQPDRPANVAQAARHFSVDESTVRRWIANGCPCVRRGRRGPGLGALVDLQELAQWRGQSKVLAGLTVEDALQKIASALSSALMSEHADIRAGIDRAACAAVLTVVFEQCCREFGKTYRFDNLPVHIQATMREL